MKKILTWVKPTGLWMHLWNYLWMFQPFMKMASWKKAYLFIPDLHSLTSVHDKKIMEANKRRLLVEIFSLLPEKTDITVFEQSRINRINDIAWILSSVTPYSLMLRAHSFKDSVNKKSDLNMAVFNYPILMASDILSYDIDIVPVWKDQKQHLEFARDIAEYFHKAYKQEIFTLPDAYIEKSVQTIVGTDGRKMSKSYNNFIGVFDDDKLLKKKIMSIKTDDTPLEEPKNPESCNVFSLIKHFASSQKINEIKDKYKGWNYGYGHAKLELFEIIKDFFREAREKYKYYDENFHLIEEKLAIWNSQANILADKKYEKLLEVVGL